MKWSSAVSEMPSLGDAVAECVDVVGRDLGGVSPDLTVAFVSEHHEAQYEALPDLVRTFVGGGVVIGCSGGGVIGAGREVERTPGFAMTSALLPGVELRPFHVEDEDIPGPDAPPESWESLVDTPASGIPHFVLLADPFSVQAEQLLSGLDYAFPDSVKIGGLASGAQRAGGNALYAKNQAFRSGVAGVSMSGAIEVDTIVAQGCRPVGEPMQVTSCSEHVLLELDRGRPLDVVKELFEASDDRDRQLLQSSLLLGIVMDPLKDSPELGDYLVRGIVGADHKRGALAVGATLREGQIVQFHVRDAETSSQDLAGLLARYSDGTSVPQATGALLFSCLGRGIDLYGHADHDTDMFREKVRPVPLTGFFCNGEIGPVGDATYVHGWTSSFGIFKPPDG